MRFLLSLRHFDELKLLITKTSYTCHCCRHARFKRSRTVHWASRPLCGPSVDVRGAVDTLTSEEWEKQHDALQILSYFFGANLHTECHELRSWSLEQIQQLCSGLVFAASSLRSQVSRMAIEGIKSTVKLLTSEQLEPVTRSLFFGLVGRVGGDASTAFLRNEACEAINLLAERAPALALLVCLNDACHNTPSRSLLGRRCLVRCYAAVLPRLLTPSACLSKGNQHSLPTRKHQDTFNRMLPHLASFLRNGDFETSSFSTPRMPRRPTFRCVTHGRSGSRLFDRRTTTSPPPAPLPLTPRSPLPNEVVQCDYYIDGSKVTMLRLGERERLLSLLKLGAQINESDVPIELSTPEILDLVSPMLRDENEEVVVTALKLCLDARRLDLRNSCCKHYEEKFCPGLLSLLCEREDTEGFTSVLALIYRQLHSKLIAVSNLSRKCLDETRRILGAGALVKPLLQAIHLSTSGTASLVHELCDITADLDVESPLIARHLLPAAAQLLRRCHPLAEAGWRQCNEVDTAEHDAVATFIKCLANLAGVDALHATTAIEGLNNEILQHFLVPD